MAMQNQQNISLRLTLEEINQVLSALGDQPYVKVFQLIQKIQQQASGQMETQAFPADQLNPEEKD